MNEQDSINADGKRLRYKIISFGCQMNGVCDNSTKQQNPPVGGFCCSHD